MSSIEDRPQQPQPDRQDDPLTSAPAAHPVGTAIGSAGGAVAGAAMGAPFGPLGFLVGGTLGAVAGGAAGHVIADHMDPREEVDYWRGHYGRRPYVMSDADYERDYLPAFLLGVNKRNEQRATHAPRGWDQTLEAELMRDWDEQKGDSALGWFHALPAVKDAWDRTSQSYDTYDQSDRWYASRFADASYRQAQHEFSAYRNAYRLGTFARSRMPDQEWNDALESELAQRWESIKGDSPLSWEEARPATRDAWENIDQVRGYGATDRG